MIKNYELMVLFSPELTSDALQKLQDKISHIITSAEGKVSKIDVWGRRPMAYKIKKFTDAVYSVYYFSLDTAKAQAAERDVLQTDGVIRHVFIIAEEQA